MSARQGTFGFNRRAANPASADHDLYVDSVLATLESARRSDVHSVTTVLREIVTAVWNASQKAADEQQKAADELTVDQLRQLLLGLSADHDDWPITVGLCGGADLGYAITLSPFTVDGDQPTLRIDANPYQGDQP